MKLISLIPLFLFLLSTAHAHRPYIPTHQVTVKKGDIHHGVQFPEGSILTLISSSGVVASATLSRDFKMNGHLLKQGSSLSIWGNGALFELSPVSGQKIGDLEFQAGEASLRFTNNCALESASLHADKEIHGYRFGKNMTVEFHPNGKLSRGTLAEEQVKNGLKLKPHSEIRFFPTEQIQAAKLSGESTVGNYKIKGDPNPANASDVEFYPNGRLKAAILSQNAVIDGYRCDPGNIAFFESGKIKELTLGEDRVVKLHPYLDQSAVEKPARRGDRINLSEDGRVMGWSSRR